MAGGRPRSGGLRKSAAGAAWQLYKCPALLYRIGFFHPIGGIPMSKHKKHERHKELDRRRKRRKERLKERVRQAIAAKKA